MSQHQLDRALERGDDIGEKREDIRQLFDYSMSTQESVEPDPPPEHHVGDPNLEASLEDVEEVVAEEDGDDVDEYDQLLHYDSSQESVVEVSGHAHEPAQLPLSQAQDFIDVFDSPQPAVEQPLPQEDQQEEQESHLVPTRQYVPGWHAEAAFQVKTAQLRRLLNARYGDRAESYFRIRACRGVLVQQWRRFLDKMDQLAEQVEQGRSRLIYTVGVFHGSNQQVPVAECNTATEFFLSCYSRLNVYEVLTALGYNNAVEVEADYDVVFCIELWPEKQMHTMLNNWVNDTSKPHYSAFGIPYLEVESDALEIYKELIAEGKIPWRMAGCIHRPTYRRHTAILDKLVREMRHTFTYREPVTVYLIIGPPGAGKSSFALDVLTGGDPRQAYWAQRGDYQEGYLGQRVFVLDECSQFYSLAIQGTSSSPFRIENLKEMTSSTCRFTINKKFGSQPFTSEIIALISNYPPEEWSLSEENLKHLLDRVHFKMQFDVTVLSPTRKLYTFNWSKGDGFTRTLNHNPAPPPLPGDWTDLYMHYQAMGEQRKQEQRERNTVHNFAHLHARTARDKEESCMRIVDHDQEEEARSQRPGPPTTLRTPTSSQLSRQDYTPEVLSDNRTMLTPQMANSTVATPRGTAAVKRRRPLRQVNVPVKTEEEMTSIVVEPTQEDRSDPPRRRGPYMLPMKLEDVEDDDLPRIHPDAIKCGHRADHFTNAPTKSVRHPGKEYVRADLIGQSRKTLKLGQPVLVLTRDNNGTVDWREARVRSLGVQGGITHPTMSQQWRRYWVTPLTHCPGRNAELFGKHQEDIRKLFGGRLRHMKVVDELPPEVYNNAGPEIVPERVEADEFPEVMMTARNLKRIREELRLAHAQHSQAIDAAHLADERRTAALMRCRELSDLEGQAIDALDRALLQEIGHIPFRHN
ncbi:unnamed protein product, partial [Mesorhabditis spiculigera]